jgi:hypothetical protein
MLLPRVREVELRVTSMEGHQIDKQSSAADRARSSHSARCSNKIKVGMDGRKAAGLLRKGERKLGMVQHRRTVCLPWIGVSWMDGLTVLRPVFFNIFPR